MSRQQQKFRIIHLSDLHISSDALEKPDVRLWYRELFDDIRRCLGEAPALDTFVVVSGDLTLSARPSEFQAASAILDQLLEAAHAPKHNLVIVPGNHDVSLSAPALRNRDAFFGCAKKFVRTGENPSQPLRRFDEHGVVFLTPGGTEELDEDDVLKLWENVEDSLEARDYGDELRVAVVHYPLDWSVQSTRKQSRGIEWLESVCAPFVERSRPKLILHGHVHEFGNFTQRGGRGRDLTVGAGPLSGEAWRRLSCGPPVYHIFTVSEDDIEVRSRFYMAQSHRWLDQSELWSDVKSSVFAKALTSRKLLPGGSIAADKSKAILADRLCRISQYDLASLTNDLGAAVSDYSPLMESREEFVRRLVNYFDEEGGLELLARYVAQLEGTDTDRRLRILFAAANDGKKIASKAAKMCSALGMVTWLTDRDSHRGADAEVALLRSIRTADVFVVVVSSGISRSKWVSKEIGIALQCGAATGRPRIISLVRWGCELPGALLGLQAIKLDEDDKLGPKVMDRLLRAFRDEQCEESGLAAR